MKRKMQAMSDVKGMKRRDKSIKDAELKLISELARAENGPDQVYTCTKGLLEKDCKHNLT